MIHYINEFKYNEHRFTEAKDNDRKSKMNTQMNESIIK